MRIDFRRKRRLHALCLGVAALCAAGTGDARAGSWTNHIDASMINQIVVRGQTLYIASYGGLLLYNLANGTFEQYRNDDGLPTNSLTCLAFDSDGNIYAGTADVGIAKIRLSNGRVTLIRTLSEQIDGLASNQVNAIATWGDNLVYGSTPGAGTIVNDFAAARFFARDGLPGDDVFDVLPVGDEVYLATDGGVATLNALGIIQTVAGTPAQSHALATDGNDVWVGTDAGVQRYTPGSGWTDIGPTTQRVYSMFWDGSTMWAGARRAYMRYSGTGTNWTIFSADSIQNRYQIGNLEMRGLAVAPGGDVYLGSAGPDDLRGPNLMKFDGTRLANMRPNTPGGNNVLRLDLDLDGSLWACFFSFYVGKLMPNGNWLNYNTSIPGIQIPTNAFTNIAFLADSQGHKWFSSLSRTTLIPPRPLDELDDKLDGNYSNDVWVRHAVGSGGGDGYGTARPQRATEDPLGNRWFMSDDEGEALGWEGIDILKRDGTEWFQMTRTKDPRMVAANVIDVAYGSNYTLVAFKTAGVYRWSHRGFDWASLTNLADDAWSLIVPIASPIPGGSVINKIAIRSDQRIFVATDAGLYWTDGGLVRQIPQYIGIGPGIVSPKVQDILLDHDENLWVATDLGLNKIARDDFNDIETFLTPASFLILSGLRYPLDVVSPLVHADCRSLAIDPQKDILYIGTFSGISVYDFSPPPATPTDLSKVYVYPNPVKVFEGHAALKIANLTGPVVVEIYNLEGELVDSRTVSADGEVAWDLTSKNGLAAGTGKYIVRIVGEHGSVQRPIALIR